MPKRAVAEAKGDSSLEAVTQKKRAQADVFDTHGNDHIREHVQAAKAENEKAAKEPEHDLLAEAANERVFRMSVESPHLRGMGTTGVALLLGPAGAAWVAHVGDSRAYRLRQGRIELLTEDHSWVGEEVRARRLTPEEAEVHPRRSALLRSIGVDPEVEVDVTPVPIESGDRFLLCSDGLSGVVPHAEITATIAREAPDDAARLLIERAIALGLLPALAVCVYLGRALERRPMSSSALAILGTAGLGAGFVHASCDAGNAVHMLFGHGAAPLVAILVLLVPCGLLVKLWTKFFAARG